MAHVIDLPGCFARGGDRDQVLERIAAAIGAYHAWLRRHGEPAPPVEEPIRVGVAEEVEGSSIAERGDIAALFAPEYEPITREQMEPYFRLMDHSRADLLALVGSLPDSVLDWRPEPEAASVRGLLRHIGNAEEWYVSRLVPPETLPPEWQDDEEMPILEFLEMERRTALSRLRQLTEEELSTVHYPTQWTSRPEEPWTARKALRRFLEHEGEHTAQIRDRLEMQRRQLMARLHAARAEFLVQLLGLDDSALVELKVQGDWTMKDTLSHLASWDRWVLAELQRGVTGERPDIATVRDIDGYNAASVAAWRERPLEEALTELHQARGAWVAWMESLAVDGFFRSRPVGRGDWFAPTWIQVMEEHDREHAHETAEWREKAGLEAAPARKDVLQVALQGGREELLAALLLVPAKERTTRRLCVDWTAHDIIGHIIDWEQIAVEGLHHMAAGRDPDVEAVEDLDAWNQEHVQARRGQSWEELWIELRSARESFARALETVHEDMLSRSFEAPWGGPITPYDLVCIYIEHDREHARDLREAI
jgi:predicted RNase H-like HicB family nuclease/uncharacterized damage-inducible protein DinB